MKINHLMHFKKLLLHLKTNHLQKAFFQCLRFSFIILLNNLFSVRTVELKFHLYFF